MCQIVRSEAWANNTAAFFVVIRLPADVRGIIKSSDKTNPFVVLAFALLVNYKIYFRNMTMASYTGQLKSVLFCYLKTESSKRKEIEFMKNE